MSSWYERAAVLADSKSFSANETVSADISGYRSPVVLVTPETISGTDDTATIRITTPTGTYRIDNRTVSSTNGSDDIAVDVPQCETVEFESGSGETYSAEVRENHG